MKVIRPNCRCQFTAADVDFILCVLGADSLNSEALQLLLADPDARDDILDTDALFHAILERHDCLTISKHLYFYVLVRHVLKATGIDDREVADYVAELLAEFSSTKLVRPSVSPDSEPLIYLVDMVAALQEADDHERFLIRAHMGNVSLFLSGVFPGHIRHRVQRRGGPEMAYYEGMGVSSFRAAGEHRLARRYNLSAPLLMLSESFRATRLALNDLADRLMDFGKAEEAPDVLLGEAGST